MNSIKSKVDDPEVIKEAIDKLAENQENILPQIKQFFKDVISPRRTGS